MAETKLQTNQELERATGTAQGVYYAGFAVTGRRRDDESTFLFMAATKEAVENWWNEFMFPTPLNMDHVYPVAMFRRSDVK